MALAADIGEAADGQIRCQDVVLDDIDEAGGRDPEDHLNRQPL